MTAESPVPFGDIKPNIDSNSSNNAQQAMEIGCFQTSVSNPQQTTGFGGAGVQNSAAATAALLECHQVEIRQFNAANAMPMHGGPSKFVYFLCFLKLPSIKTCFFNEVIIINAFIVTN